MIEEYPPEEKSFLRRFIERLKDWSEVNPPSSSELDSLKHEFRLTRRETDTLNKLSHNHLRRGRKAFARENYEQAIAELARASQLRPRDAAPRVELAEIYLKRSRRRGSSLRDRKKIIELVRVASELQPNNSELQRFFLENKWIRFHTGRNRKHRLILVALLLFLSSSGVMLWQWDFIVSVLNRATPPGVEEVYGSFISNPRPVPVDTSSVNNDILNTEITFSEIGRRNDDSYLHIIGRFKSEMHSIEALKLLVQGKSMDSTVLFSMPWLVLDGKTPSLLSGDTLPFNTFRWLAGSDANIQGIEILPLEVEFSDESASPVSTGVEINWDTLRPTGCTLEAEVRNRRTIEAFDRQVLLMDLALENTGIAIIEELTFEVLLHPDWTPAEYSILKNQVPPITRGERRIFPMELSIPLHANTNDVPVFIRINRVLILD